MMSEAIIAAGFFFWPARSPAFRANKRQNWPIQIRSTLVPAEPRSYRSGHPRSRRSPCRHCPLYLRKDFLAVTPPLQRAMSF